LYSCNCGQLSVIEELVDIIGNILGKKIAPKFAEERPGDVKHSLADIGKAKELIVYRAEVSVEEGLGMILSIISEVMF